MYGIAAGCKKSVRFEYEDRVLKCTVITLPFGTPSMVRGAIEMPETLIGPTTGPCPYGMNVSMLEGDMVASTRSKSTSHPMSEE
jgi:hypothetical protein